MNINSTQKSQTPPSEDSLSPFWMGCRLSVIIPTYNRREKLRQCLHALEKQSILFQEFEVIVVDDGSTDGTDTLISEESFSFRITYRQQHHQGPGSARNLGILEAQGELVLFIGDDIIADENLLENHLLAHAHFPAQTIAILGHIDWPTWMKPNQVMTYACGDSSRQFAYKHIAQIPSLDYRFFYTSNISLKRSFLVDAAQAGIGFDPDFRFAAFEDTDFAYRLEGRSLEIKYWENAVAYHDHWMDIESFSRREYAVGQMAVVLYRKHPNLDNIIQVRWINEWTETIEKLLMNPSLLRTVKTLENDVEKFLRSLEVSLEKIIDTNALPMGDAITTSIIPRQKTLVLLDNLLEIIFETERIRGKVQEWYTNVNDQEKVQAAKSLLSFFKQMEFFNLNPREIQKLEETFAWPNKNAKDNLRSQAIALQKELTHIAPARTHFTGSAKTKTITLLRIVDLKLQAKLVNYPSLAAYYQKVRQSMKQLVKR